MDRDINEIRFSFSGLSSFDGCKHGWRLTYLDMVPRYGNFFSSYGLLCHEILEKYFRGELELFQLSDYYVDNYDRMVVETPPFFVKPKEYFKQGYEFFERFDFDKEEYDVLVIEDKIDVDVNTNSMKYGLVVKPDLVLKHKETGKVYLMDYKTSLIFKNGKLDKNKLEGYKRQMIMYAKYLETNNVYVDEVWLWFIRDEENPVFKFTIAQYDEDKVVEWIEDTIQDIHNEKDFEPTINKFFCEHLCSVKHGCEYYQTIKKS